MNSLNVCSFKLKVRILDIEDKSILHLVINVKCFHDFDFHVRMKCSYKTKSKVSKWNITSFKLAMLKEENTFNIARYMFRFKICYF